MYTKNSTIYADSGKYLVNGFAVGFTMPCGETENVIERDVDFSDMVIREMFGCKIAVCSDEKVSFMFQENSTYETILKSVIEKRYSQDEQLSIITNKDLSSDTEKEFVRLQDWIEFAKNVSKNIVIATGGTIEETLEDVKKEKLIEINKFDSSSAINSFKYGDMELWLDKSTRVGLMNSTAILQNAGQENTTLWLGSVNVTIPCSQVILMLSQIEMYALECYNKTAQHKAAVNALQTIEEVKAYDFKTGYPEKLVYEAIVTA